MDCKKCNHPLKDHSLFRGCCMVPGCNCRETGETHVHGSVNFERRIKYLSVGEQSLVTLLIGWRVGKGFALPCFKGIPKDVKCFGVYHDWTHGTFVFRLWHQDWPIVEDGSLIVECSTGIIEFVET
jgi:hypothetical protein